MKEWLRRRRHPPEKLGSGLCLGDNAKRVPAPNRC